MILKNLIKNYSIFLASYFFFVGMVQSQDGPIVKLSSPIKLGSLEYFSGHLLSDNEGHIVTSAKYSLMSTPKLFIHKLDEKFNLEKTIDLKSENKNTYALGLYKIKDKIYLLNMEKDAKNDKIKYFLVPFDRNLEPGKTKKIAEFQFEKNSDQPNVDVAMSQDSTTAAFIFYLDRDHKEDHFEMYISVMKENGEILWSKKSKIRRPQKVVGLLSTAVNNEGNVYMVIKEFEGDRPKESKKVEKGDEKIEKPAYEISVYKYNGQSQDEKEIKIELKNNFVANCNIKVLPNGDVTVIGLYSSSKKLLTNGIFSIRMDGLTDSIYHASRKSFTPEDLAILEDEDVTSKHKEETGISKFFKFLDFYSRTDGTTTIVVEENYITYRTSRVGNSTTTTTYYHTNEAIVINLDKAGEILNIAILPKKQVFAETDFFNSSTVLFTEEGLHLVHVEQKDNLDKPYGQKVKRISSLKDCVVVDIFLSKEGKAERTLLLTKQDVKALLAPKISEGINGNKIFFFMLQPVLLGKSKQWVGTIQYQ